MKNFDRAKKEGLWVGKNGKVDMKFLEKNIDSGCTDVSKVWGKPKSHVLQVMYDTEMEFGGADASPSTGNIRQPLQPRTQEPLSPHILHPSMVNPSLVHTTSDKIKVCLKSPAPNSRIEEYLSFQSLKMPVTRLVATMLTTIRTFLYYDAPDKPFHSALGTNSFNCAVKNHCYLCLRRCYHTYLQLLRNDQGRIWTELCMKGQCSRDRGSLRAW
jgi:hypothetical protein